MRLLLDVHLSARAIAPPLREAGHDVLTLAEDSRHRDLDDEAVLSFAMDEQRVLVTCNIRDFTMILRQWAAEDRRHAGCLMIVGVDHSQFRVILQCIGDILQLVTIQDDWINRVILVGRRG